MFLVRVPGRKRKLAGYDLDTYRFGELLKFYRQRARYTQKELAEALGLERVGTIGDWERGQLPSRSLDYIRQLIEILELTPEEATLLEHALAAALEPAQRERSAPRVGWLPPQVGGYVARPALEARVAEAVTTGRVTVLYGAAGLGKTTLATAVAWSAAVQAQFPDGVLWLAAPATAAPLNYAEWCSRLGVARQGRESWEATWQEWAAAPERRWLVVLDDVADVAALQPALDALSTATAFLITTQDGAIAQQVRGPWTAAEVQTVGVPPLMPEEGRALLEAALARDLTAVEWLLVEQIGTLLGWHPAALRLTLLDGQAGDWATLLTELERASGGPLGLAEWLQRQWARLGARVEQPVRQTLLEQLWYWLRDNRAFGVGAAAAVWRVTEAEARRYLRLLELTGLVEPLAEPDPGGFVGDLWRTLPAAQGVLWQPRRVYLWDRYGWPRGWLGRRLLQQGRWRWRVSWALRLAEATLFVALLPVEVVLLAPAGLWVWLGWRNTWPVWINRISWLAALAERERAPGWPLPLEYALVRDWGSVLLLAPLLALLGVLLLADGITQVVIWLPTWLPAPPAWLAALARGWLGVLGWLVDLHLGWPHWLGLLLGSLWFYAWQHAPVTLALYRSLRTPHWRYRVLLWLARHTGATL